MSASIFPTDWNNLHAGKEVISLAWSIGFISTLLAQFLFQTGDIFVVHF
jgi:hypothetical protein